jgi:hypothetical protein
VTLSMIGQVPAMRQGGQIKMKNTFEQDKFK